RDTVPRPAHRGPGRLGRGARRPWPRRRAQRGGGATSSLRGGRGAALRAPVTAQPFTARELMVVAAGREIRAGDVACVGLRLPLGAFGFGKRTDAPRAVGFFENGIVRDEPAAEMLMTMSDTPNVAGALWCASTLDVMGLLQQGLVDLGFLGAAEIDRFGNLNTSYIGDGRRPTGRRRGSGGGADIASLARRFVVIMPQERHRFRERVHFIASPGWGDGAGWRERVGLPGGGPAAVITTLGI